MLKSILNNNNIDIYIMDTFSNTANLIWSDFRNRKKTDMQFKSLNINKQLEYYQKKYERFTRSYPFVLRWMIQTNSFSKKAFKKMCDNKHTRPKGKEMETLKDELKRLNNELKVSEIIWCRTRARYVKRLHMENSRSHNSKEARRVWKNTYDMLIEEIKVLKQAEEKIKKMNEKNEKMNNDERRNELRKLLGSSNVI